jgi:hypothetical protein
MADKQLIKQVDVRASYISPVKVEFLLSLTVQPAIAPN